MRALGSHHSDGRWGKGRGRWRPEENSCRVSPRHRGLGTIRQGERRNQATGCRNYSVRPSPGPLWLWDREGLEEGRGKGDSPGHVPGIGPGPIPPHPHSHSVRWWLPTVAACVPQGKLGNVWRTLGLVVTTGWGGGGLRCCYLTGRGQECSKDSTVLQFITHQWCQRQATLL